MLIGDFTCVMRTDRENSKMFLKTRCPSLVIFKPSYALSEGIIETNKIYTAYKKILILYICMATQYSDSDSDPHPPSHHALSLPLPTERASWPRRLFRG